MTREAVWDRSTSNALSTARGDLGLGAERGLRCWRVADTEWGSVALSSRWERTKHPPAKAWGEERGEVGEDQSLLEEVKPRQSPGE